MANNIVKFLITGDASNFTKAAGQAAGATDKLAVSSDKTAKHSVALGTAIGVAAGGIATFGIASVKAALDGEKSQAQLDTAIRNTGGSVAQLTPKIEAQASEWAKYGYQNDQVNETLAKLTTVTGSAQKGMDLLQVTTDLAKGRNIALSQAATIVSKVVNGNVEGLSRLGIATKDSTGQTLTSAQALDALAKKYGGVADAIAKTPSGKIAAFRAEFQNFEETVGNEVLPIVTQFGTVTIRAVKDVQGAFDSLPGPMKTVVEVGGGLALGAIAISKGYGVVSSTFDGVKGAIEEVRSVAGKIGSVFTSGADEIVASSAKADAAIASVGDTAEVAKVKTGGLSGSLGSMTSGLSGFATVGTVAVAALYGLDKAASAVASSFDKAAFSSNSLAQSVGRGNFDAQTKALKDALGTSAGDLGSIGLRTLGAGISGGLSGILGTPDKDITKRVNDAVQTGLAAIQQLPAKLRPAYAKAFEDSFKVDGKVPQSIKDAVDRMVEAAAAGDKGQKKLADAMAATGNAATTAGGAVGTNTQKTKDNAAAADAAAQKWSDYGKALHGITDPLFGAITAEQSFEQAQKAATDAQTALTKAVHDYGAASPEAAAATKDLQDAQNGLLSSNVSLDSSLASLEGAFADGSITVDKAKGVLQGWVAQGRISQDTANGVVLKLEILKAQADKLDGTNVGIGVTANTDDANNKIDNLISKLAGLSGPGKILGFSVGVTAPAKVHPKVKAMGGPLRAGELAQVGENRSELWRENGINYFLPGGDGVVIPSAGLTPVPPIRSAAAHSTASTTPVIVNINVTTGPVADKVAIAKEIGQIFVDANSQGGGIATTLKQLVS